MSPHAPHAPHVQVIEGERFFTKQGKLELIVKRLKPCTRAPHVQILEEGERLSTKQGELELLVKRLRGELKDAQMERDLWVALWLFFYYCNCI